MDGALEGVRLARRLAVGETGTSFPWTITVLSICHGYRKDQAQAHQLKTEAAKFGLADADFNALTFQYFGHGKRTITWYPASNANARRFLDHLVDSGKADRTD